MTSRWAYLLALGSGVALSFAFPEPDVAPLAWVALAPFFIAVTGATWGRGARLGLVLGVGFFGALLVWASIVGWVAWALLVLLQTFFFVLFGAIWGPLSGRLRGPGRIAGVAVLWAGVELVRQETPVVGFPWGQLAQSQHNLSWMLRPAAIGGSLLVAAVVVAVNGAMSEGYRAMQARNAPAAAGYVAAAIVFLAAPLLIPASTASGRSLDVAIVQGSVPDSAPSLVKDIQIVTSHVRLTDELHAGRPQGSPDLIVWPESSVGIDLTNSVAVREQVAGAARRAGAPMLVGGNRDLGSRKYAVMIFQLSADGAIVDSYQKTHLVPFGEYVPMRDVIGGLPQLAQVPSDALPGHVGKVFDVDGAPVAGVISFEGDFGSLVRERIDQGGRLLVIATNTSTWERSWASAQHVAFSQVRAAENGVWVVHAALSGISAFIAPDGSVQDSLGLDERASATHTVHLAERITLYARFGNLMLVPLLIVALTIMLVSGVRRRSMVDGDDR